MKVRIIRPTKLQRNAYFCIETTNETPAVPVKKKAKKKRGR